MQPDDDLSIPAFLKREDTPEGAVNRARLVKQLRRGGVTRRVGDSRSTISTGYARLDDTSKAILREMIQPGGLKGVERERAVAALRKRSNAMANTPGTKETALRKQRNGLTEMADALASFNGPVTKCPTGRAEGVKVDPANPTPPAHPPSKEAKVKTSAKKNNVVPMTKPAAATPANGKKKAVANARTPVGGTTTKLAYDWDANEALAKAGKIPALGPWKSYDYHMKDARDLCMKGDAKGAREIMDGHRNAVANRDRFYKLLKTFLKAAKHD